MRVISRSTFLHLRIPFSFFLLPVYVFALSISNNPFFGNVLSVFLIMHFFIYPASNGYNSYFDRDEESIGLLKDPPKVTRELYFTALILDVVAVILGFLIIGWEFSLMIFVYGLVSKAYSHPFIRIKRFPVSSWLIAGFFQGFFSFLTCYAGINQAGFSDLWHPAILIPALLSSMLLWGSYPMTQIYQHKEDQKRGDITLSLKLGILGTFHFTAVFFTLAAAGFFYYYLHFNGLGVAILFLFVMTPMVIFFLTWYFKVNRRVEEANYGNTMKLNLISAISLNLFFLLVTLVFPVG